MAFVEVKDLVKIYPTGEKALQEGVSFSLGSQEILGLIGPSGSGKSTLLRCVNRLVEPTSGKIMFDGVEITALTINKLTKIRREIGMIFQEFNLIDRMSVIHNILVARSPVTSLWRCVFRRFHKSDVEEAYEMCNDVGLSDHAFKRVDALSGGQRQRVGIARALFQKPRLLLVDEPTSSLDIKIQDDIMNLIYTLSKERHVPALVSIHDVELAKRYSDCIVGLQAGRKIFEGKPKELDREILDTIYQYD